MGFSGRVISFFGRGTDVGLSTCGGKKQQKMKNYRRKNCRKTEGKTKKTKKEKPQKTIIGVP